MTSSDVPNLCRGCTTDILRNFMEFRALLDQSLLYIDQT